MTRTITLALLGLSLIGFIACSDSKNKTNEINEAKNEHRENVRNVGDSHKNIALDSHKDSKNNRESSGDSKASNQDSIHSKESHTDSPRDLVIHTNQESNKDVAGDSKNSSQDFSGNSQDSKIHTKVDSALESHEKVSQDSTQESAHDLNQDSKPTKTWRKETDTKREERLKEEAKYIAGSYDFRAYNGKGGYNAFQKKELFIDEIGIVRPAVTTLYENMSLDIAYQSYLQNSGGDHYTKLDDKILWLPKLPKESTHKEILLDFAQLRPQGNDKTRILLFFDFIYETPKKLLITYQAYSVGEEVEYNISPKYSIFTLLFEEKDDGTYLTLSSTPKNVTFSCTQSGLSQTESAICKANLALDLKMHYAYETLQQDIENRDGYQNHENGKTNRDYNALKTSQRAWVKSRNACGKDIECIKDSYTKRIATLQDELQQRLINRGFDKTCKLMRSVSVDGGWSPGEEYEDWYQCEYKNANLLDMYAKYALKENEGKEQWRQWLGVDEIAKARPNDESRWKYEGEFINDMKTGFSSIDYEWAGKDTLIVSVYYEYNPQIYTFTQKGGDVIVDFKDITAP
ncbi:hypothetical protein CCZ01_06660 [Helicobacter monodelphidis]|uniref:hypothetical protein n=1 Tax=Helicobacter sp. 15-1451 TaxID=2004995 RepID=UPI000DCC3883|nr:hypothetical protein [Helicobacter sp. 15-1451]RAX57254.1 hypothetical protein CCZ01_06660 [Helicobacter sp. 15-1451]